MLCPRGELRRLIDELLPARAVLRELGPLLEVSRYACPRERLVQRMPERELWTPMLVSIARPIRAHNISTKRRHHLQGT